MKRTFIPIALASIALLAIAIQRYGLVAVGKAYLALLLTGYVIAAIIFAMLRSSGRWR